jgi:hypothetical protein
VKREASPKYAKPFCTMGSSRTKNKARDTCSV